MEAWWWHTTARQWVRPRGDRERKGSGQAGAGWGRRRLGAGSRSSYAGASVPARPPSSGLAALRAQGSSGEGNESQQTPGAASTPLGAAILCATGWGKRRNKEGGTTNSDQSVRPKRRQHRALIGPFERRPNIFSIPAAPRRSGPAHPSTSSWRSSHH